jgi:flagellar basal-body rod modification protein FlgD
MSIAVTSTDPNSTVSSTGASTGTRKTSLSQTDFMNLFVTQMQYQDPLAPMDNNQMATQMAQFSSVQALQDMTQSLNTLSASQTTLNNLCAPGLIGRQVEAKGNTITIASGVVAAGSYQLSKAGNVQIQILNSSGNIVQSIPAGQKDTSKQQVQWDGKDQNGNTLADGKYTFQVSAMDSQGQSISVSSYRVGTVTGISYENGVAQYKIGDENIAFGDIVGIVG